MSTKKHNAKPESKANDKDLDEQKLSIRAQELTIDKNILEQLQQALRQKKKWVVKKPK